MYALSFFSAWLIGFAAHRASLCNVRAVAEIMSAGSAHMLASLLQAALWMAVLTGVLVLGFGHRPASTFTVTPVALPLLGGWLFGMGAAFNGGCSLSTLNRLADGDLGMLSTLMGFAAGLVAWFSLLAARLPWQPQPVQAVWVRWPLLSPWLLAGVLIWALLRLRVLVRLWYRQQPVLPLHRLLVAPSYHLTVSAAIMGLAGGLLYATQGAWTYTNFLRTAVGHGLGSAATVGPWHSALVVALMAGMVASALQRGSLNWHWPVGTGTWLRHACAGALMGLGAAMVPGGNDTMLLNGLPTITWTALAVYLSMLAGIASVLGGMRWLNLPVPMLACTPAGCDERRAAPGH